MTYIPQIRSIPAATMPQNKAAIDALRLAVSELGGSIGAKVHRAVRLGELVDAGYLQFNADGTVSRRGDGDLRTLTEGLDFVGDSLRIRADFTNPDFNKRAMFQTNVPDGSSVVGVVPNGAGTITAVRAFTAADAMNAQYVGLVAQPSLMVLQANKTGSALQPDLAVQIGGVELARFLATSNVIEFANLGTAVAGSKIQFGSPGSAPGVVGLYGATLLRRDIRFASDSVMIGASTGAGAPTTFLRIFDTGLVEAAGII
jgi:hypothetical protein